LPLTVFCTQTVSCALSKLTLVIAHWYETVFISGGVEMHEGTGCHVPEGGPESLTGNMILPHGSLGEAGMTGAGLAHSGEPCISARR
jgi:hypothetical protein